MRAYIDSDILIWHLRGGKKALSFFHEIRKKKEYELWLGAMQRAEVVFFMIREEEKITMQFLSQFKTAEIDQSVVDEAARLYRVWHPSHGIDVNDAFLAATTIRTGGKIYTLNSKHFPMPNLIVETPF